MENDYILNSLRTKNKPICFRPINGYLAAFFLYYFVLNIEGALSQASRHCSWPLFLSLSLGVNQNKKYIDYIYIHIYI